MNKIKFGIVILKSLLIISFFLTPAMFSCKRPVGSNSNFVKCKLRLTDFIKDFYYGDMNGISTRHVNYEVTIKVMERINGSIREVRGYYNLKSPTGPDKSIFETTIEVPEAVNYRIDVIVNGIECSVKTVMGCNTFITYGPPTTIFGPPAEFLNNAGKPYWLAEVLQTGIPSGNEITIRPLPFPRNSDGSGSCGCKMKLK
jgi:hypothetical protein